MKFKLFHLSVLISFLILIIMLSSVSAVDSTNEMVNVKNFTELNNTICNGKDVNLTQNISDGTFGDGILINKNITINGNGYCIDAHQSGRIFQITNDSVVLTLINLTLINGKVIGDSGGAIDVNGNLVINAINVSFNNNTASRGGAIDVNGNLVINATNVGFNNNKANNGSGAIHAKGIVTIKATNNIVFLNNFANIIGTNYLGGGVISAHYYNNESISIYCNVTLISTNGNIIICNNTATKSGGAILAENIIITASSIEFYNNKANNDGGVIKALGKVIINATGNVNFYNNTAKFGGGVIKALGDVVINGSNVSFNNNVDNYDGGAIYTQNGNVVINTINMDCNNNTANNGGAIRAQNGNVVIDVINMDCNNNTANYGGAINAGNDVVINACNMSFIKNIAIGGSAIYSRNVIINVINMNFNNNTATGSGGAIYSRNVVINACNVNFNNNDGGAINGCNDVVINATGDVNFNNNNVTGDGAAIRAKGIVNITSINNIVFLNNFAKSIAINNLGGAAISAYYYSFSLESVPIYCNVTLRSANGNIIFRNNTVCKSGGAIVAGNTTIKANNIEFNNNKANNDGGAIYSKGKIIINNASFINNNGELGSTIYAKDIELNNTKIESNSNNNVLYITGIASFKNNTYILSNKTIAPIIFNGTNITSHIIAIVYNNNTEFAKVGSKTQINVTFYDDNNNIIAILNDTFANVTLNNMVIGYLVNNGLKSNLIYNSNIEGRFLICVKSDALSNLTVKTALLIVSKKDSDVNIEGVLSNTTIGGNIIITLNENATGKVTITINNTNYNGNLKNGAVTIYVPILFAGECNLLLNYTGDKQFNPIVKNYNITVSKVNNYTINVTGNITGGEGIVEVVLPTDAIGNVTVTINDVNYTASLIKGIAIINIPNLTPGSYNVTTTYNGDNKYTKKVFTQEIIFKSDIELVVSDLVMYYHDGSKLVAYLVDSIGKGIANVTVYFNINGKIYTRFTNSLGVTSLDINLNHGKYDVIVSALNLTKNVTVTVLSTVVGKDIVKIYHNDTQYYAYFSDFEGNPLKNTNVKFNINGVFYTRKTNESGVAKLNINLNPGVYVLTAFNPINNEAWSNNITVISTIQGEDVVKMFRNDTQYKAQFFNIDGSVLANIDVQFNINGVFYTKNTDKEGYATLAINLQPGNYTITAYNPVTKELASNNIEIKPILVGKDLTKIYGEKDHYEVLVYDNSGNPLASANITININGVYYNVISGVDGIARLNINLLPGEYIATAYYNSFATSNKIIVKEE